MPAQSLDADLDFARDRLLEFEPVRVAGVPFAPRLVRLSGEERLSQPFGLEWELIWDGPPPPADRLVGQSVSASLLLADGTRRWFNGHVRRFVSLGKTHGGRRYRAEVVPWLWFLSQSTACRVFYRGGTDIKVRDVVDEVLADLNGLTNYEWVGTGENRDLGREYRVQYDESDLAFVSRVLEEAGIYYYFKHEKGAHKLVLCDPPATPDRCLPGTLELVEPTVEGVHTWEHACRFTSQKFALADYAETDSQVPTGNAASGNAPTQLGLPKGPGVGAFNRFEFPGGFWTDTQGKDASELRMEQLESGFQAAAGKGSHRTLAAGKRFAFREDDGSEAQDYLLVSVSHDAHSPLPKSGAAHPRASYENHFECLPTQVVRGDAVQLLTYRPPRVTPRPVIQGPQTALVVGADGTTTLGGTAAENVNVDSFGRVRVRFPWQSSKTPQSSDEGTCWVRVSQTWAGNSWGSMHVPWIGHEVVVEFLDGDPERPLITGRVYNANTALPKTHELPASKLHTVLAADAAGNEIFFDGSPDGVRGVGIVTANADGDDNKKSKTKAAVMIGVSEGMTYVTNEASKAIHLGSEFSLAGGATCEIFVGGKAGITVGQSSEIFVGTNLELALAANQSYTMGTNYDFKMAEDMSFVVGSEFSFTLGNSCEVHLGLDTGYNLLDTGMISATEVAMIGGMTTRGSAVVNSKMAELRFGQSSGVDAWMPLIGTLATAITTGATGAVESLTGLVPMVSSAYAVVTKVIEAGAGVAITAGTTAGTAKGSANEDEEPGNAAMTSWARETGAGINEQVEGFVSGTGFAAAGLIEGAALAGANLAICELAIILLKAMEAKPATLVNGVVRADAEGVTLIAGQAIPGEETVAKDLGACYVALDGAKGGVMLSSTLGKIEFQAPQVNIGDRCSPNAITIGASSTTITIKGMTVGINGQNLTVS